LRGGATGGRRLLGTAFELAGDLGGKVRRGLESTFGGPARTRVIVLLALVLALSSADTATVGASATELRQALHIDNTDIGLLVSVTGAVGAVASVPFGVLVDRFNRINLLVVAMLLWGLTMLGSAAVSTFGALLLVRVFLGAITALAGPAVASLIGDYFASAERGKIYGYVLGGELIGAGVGFFITGDVAAISWRAAFVVLAIPAFALAWQVRKLPEPARGGASRLIPGSTLFVSRQQAQQRADTVGDQQTSAPEELEVSDAQRTAQQRGIRPDPNLILRTDPRKMNIVAAARYVLKVRTNVILILSSACAYFFLTGIQTFGLEFVGDQYRVHTILANLLLLVVGAGAVGGVLVGGRLGDDLIRRGYISGRVLVAGVAAVATVLLFIPPLLTRSPFTALPYVAAAAFCLTAQNPPLDAARLDIMVPLLWGRAEGIRTFLRTAAQSIAPVAFGGLSDLLGNNHSSLRTTFLIMLLPLAASGLILLRGIRYYPTDVATAAASLAASEEGAPPPADAPDQPPGDVLG
jgi:MFS family permease